MSDNLKPCKSCGKDVSATAKKCPHCEQDHPTVTNKGMIKLFIGLIVVAWIAVTVFGGQSMPDLKGEPKNYTIINQDISTKANDTRSFTKILIYAPEAKNFDDRAATVAKAAIDSAKEGIDISAIFLMRGNTGKSELVAQGKYIPDGKGITGKKGSTHVWEIWSSKDSANGTVEMATEALIVD